MNTCPLCGAPNPEESKFCPNCGIFFGDVPPDVQMPYPHKPYPYPQEAAAARYAGFWIRFAAYIIDTIVLWVVRYPMALIFWLASDDFSMWGGPKHGADNLGLYIIYSVSMLVFWFGYFVIMTGRYQATVGKMVLNLKVVGEDMGPISYGTAALRETIGKIASWIICGLGFIWIGFDKRKQGWQDKIARTFVVYTMKNPR